MTTVSGSTVAQPRSVHRSLAGWGNYPVEECEVYRPERIDELGQIVLHAPEASLIGRGHGRSYGDAALNGGAGVVLHDRLNRLLSFDPDAGVARVEAAVSLAEMIDHFLPRGFFFPVTPGTKHISIGGAIAANVHGKNHHRDGSISSQLCDFRLMTASGDVVHCSREENSDLFWATLGGMGLTGLILDARLQLRSVANAYLHCETERTPDLDSTLESIISRDCDFAYAAAWIDCLARGRSMGRSVLLRANPAATDELPRAALGDPLSISSPSLLRVPFNLPSFAINSFNMRVFNTGFYHLNRPGSAIANYERYFYMLDAVLDWNRVYGKNGVVQYQIVLPQDDAREPLVHILDEISKSGRGSFLAVLKSMGPEDEGLLSFPMPGMTLALDFPYTGPDLIALLHRLDDCVLQHGGRVYLAKDACLSREHFEQMYPGLDRFREIKAKVDPQGRFSSSLARRLGLVEPS